MKRSFYIFWIIGAILIAGLSIVGLGLLSAMALNPTGYVSPTDWGYLFSVAAGLVLYWTALCWAVGLLRRKPLVSALIASLTAVIAFGYPSWDQARYRDQRAQAVDAGRIGIPPDWSNKTALLIWAGKEECDYNCWNLALHMEARVVFLTGASARDVDFSVPVDLTTLAFEELVQPDGVGTQSTQLPADVTTFDYVILHHARSSDFDGVFDAQRPAGIAPNGLQIDSLIVEVTDATQFDLSSAPIILRLVHVSRNISEVPFMPGLGRRSHWNYRDRVANDDRAASYFCSAASRSPRRCNNAFD